MAGWVSVMTTITRVMPSSISSCTNSLAAAAHAPPSNVMSVMGNDTHQEMAAASVGAAAPAGERPCRKRGHEDRAPDNPPEHATATPKVVAGCLAEPHEDRAHAQHESEIKTDCHIVVCVHQEIVALCLMKLPFRFRACVVDSRSSRSLPKSIGT